MRFKQNIIAIVYDFDGTLSPQPMYDYGVLPALKIEPDEFWKEVSKKAKKDNADPMLCYMYLLLKKGENTEGKLTFKVKDLKKLSKKIRYYRGVPQHFEKLEKYVEEKSKGQVKLRFYLISAGLKEILDGISIKRKFHNIFASEYYRNNYGEPLFPKILVNDTIKTQYLFRINKGKELQHERINEHMPEDQRLIPFKNIIYIGDGMTDVPGMTVTIKNGGRSIAVYEPGKRKARETCLELFEAGRVHHIASADFTRNSKLMQILRTTLDLIIHDILFWKSVHKQKRLLVQKKKK
ncbi:MAG TPA: haloacid dehalogenase-like hydrolase [candidate division Zixibacteria bacterium]|nr:haloacid dehalogenase-like hydrolase [candidate division Zixibacteria bacterium]